MVAILLHRGADVNTQTSDEEKLTPLQIAASNGFLTIIQLLVDYKANIELSTPEGWRALHFAADNLHLEVLMYLLANGANPSPVANYKLGNEEKQVTPLDIVIQKNEKLIIGGMLSRADVRPFRFIPLSDLKLNGANLIIFPVGLINFQCLLRLDVSQNRFQSLPDGLSSMSNLEKLNLSNNELTEFPPVLCKITTLVNINLSNNKIAHITPDISVLQKLERLDVSFNLLESLPEALGKLARLKKLNIESNPLVAIPKEVLSRGVPKVLEYLQQLGNSVSSWKRVKLMLLGEEGVGKSSRFSNLQSTISFFIGEQSILI